MARVPVIYAPTVRTVGIVEVIEARDFVRDPEWIQFRCLTDIRSGPPVIPRRVEDVSRIERLA